MCSIFSRTSKPTILTLLKYLIWHYIALQYALVDLELNSCRLSSPCVHDMGEGDNCEMGSNLNDWIKILATFILDIVKCHCLQTNDSEMNQRINHLVFILNLVKEGNIKQLCTVLQDLKTLLVYSYWTNVDSILVFAGRCWGRIHFMDKWTLSQILAR